MNLDKSEVGPAANTRWYNIFDSDLEGIANGSVYMEIPFFWKEAIKNPGIAVRYVIEGYRDTFAYYDPERQQILGGLYDCPSYSGHHLYMTCPRCGQYG